MGPAVGGSIGDDHGRSHRVSFSSSFRVGVHNQRPKIIDDVSDYQDSEIYYVSLQTTAEMLKKGNLVPPDKVATRSNPS